MNYVILNGIKSTTIKGLLISSLPPISKPLMRTEIEEIDGRDGDIVTKLGYAAYDKEISIGLHGDFDINEVISYFNSEGTVTFSNEPDKYYNYQIIEQIDFERLIRFRTATVTFHVQPFKYSLVEKAKPLIFESNLLSVPDYTQTKSGVTLDVLGGVFTFSGTPSAAVEFYVPVDKVSLSAGNYTLEAYANGTSPQACSIRLINDSPSTANSFGGKYVTLQNDSAVTIEASLDAAKTFNYLYFYIGTGSAMDFTLSFVLHHDDFNLTIKNSGNYIAKPIITIYGMDTINLSLNNRQAFVIELGDEEYITIDTAAMEASKDGILKNRLVTGDYNNFELQVGQNGMSVTGAISEIIFENYSRWL